jgi:phospholipid-binding lipoprotein MlaA
MAMRAATIASLPLACLTLALAPAPAWAQGGAPGDPWEGLNRKIYGSSQAVDRVALRPVALAYKAALPQPVRTGVRNVLNNIGEANTFVNDVLQLRFANAGKTVIRFAFNSTVGVAGVFDVAGRFGTKIHYNDFGQTLGHYGAPPGPYIYLPLLGPSTVRDGAGRLVDIYTGLFQIHDLHVSPGARLGVAVVDGLDTRASVDDDLIEIQRTSTDEYATERSLYLQNRRALIENPDKAIKDLPDFDEPAPPPAPAMPPAQATVPKE